MALTGSEDPVGPPAADPPAAGSIRRDLVSAYAAAAAKASSWVLVSAVAYRADAAAFAMIALVRGTVGLLNYTTLGLGPSMIRLLAELRARRQRSAAADPLARAYSAGMAVALLTGVAGFLLTALYARYFPLLHQTPPGLPGLQLLVVGMGAGVVFRLMGEAPAGVLQTGGRIAADNLFLACAEVAWVACAAVGYYTLRAGGGRIAAVVGVGYAFSGAALLLLRLYAASRLVGRLLPDRRLVSWPLVRRLIAFGSLVAVAQLGDFLYAPTDFILINRLIGPEAVADYAPAVQIDAGLLLLVSGLAGVLLPKAALAHASGDARLVRRYYVRGTLASLAALAAAAAVVWLVSKPLFRLWLGADLPRARAILPLVLVHTVVGGSSAVGRSVLLAMGKVKPFTVSVLIAGAANVALSYALVVYGGMGLWGIVLGTVVVVVARCAVWTPWYVLRTLRPVQSGGR